MKIAKVVTVLDIELWEARECFGPVFFKQLQHADLIQLNKIDMVEPHRIPFHLNEIHESMPHAKVIPTIDCAIDPEMVMDGRAMGVKLANYTDLSAYQGNRKSRNGSLNPVSFTFQTGDAIDEARYCCSMSVIS